MVRFIITTFGDRYTGMLLSCIYSIQTSNPESAISVFWEDIDLKKLEIIKTAFPKVTFEKTNFDIPQEQAKRISSKIRLQTYACSKKYTESFLCFIDVDTLVIKDISKIAYKLHTSNKFDIVFTFTDKTIALNTGVVLCKNNQKINLFFSYWQRETEKITKDNNLLKEATNDKSIYGAADQMAFYKIISYSKEKDEYKININNEEIILKGVRCEILNEIRSVPISEKTHIIHYKSEWQTILIDGGEFTNKRPWKDSKDMFIFYIKNYIEAFKLIKQQDELYRIESFNIRIPNYIDPETGSLKKLRKIKHNVFYNIKKVIYKIPGMINLKEMIRSKIRF